MKYNIFKQVWIAIIIVLSCGYIQAQTYSDVKAAVAELNTEMPLSIGPMGELTSVAIDGQYVVLRMEVNSGGSLNSFSAQEYKKNLLSLFSLLCLADEDMSSAFKALINVKMGMKISILDEKTRASLASVTITLEELKQGISSEPDPHQLLLYLAKASNASYPMTIYGMTITSSEVFNGYFITNVIIDESQYDFDAFKQQKETMKKAMLDNIKEGSDMSVMLILMLCYMDELGYAYDYVGSNSKQRIRIGFTAEEVDALFE